MHFLGGVALIAGTAVGAGMLTLPVVTAYAGFWPSVLLFSAMAAMMAYVGLLILEIVDRMPVQATLVSMAHYTLGPWGRMVAAVSYFFLLYALNTAYVDGLSALSASALQSWGSPLVSPTLGSALLLGIMGVLSYKGPQVLEGVNRVLVVCMIGAFFCMLYCLFPMVQAKNLSHASWPPFFGAMPVVATSFGYHIIIPSIYDYFERNAKKTRSAILAGTLLPLAIYVLWQLAVMGTLPLEGTLGLASGYREGLPATQLLQQLPGQQYLSLFAWLFATCAIATSFLGVSWSLIGLLAGGFSLSQDPPNKLGLCLMAFVPPLIFSHLCPRLFFSALGYAGAMVALLIGFLPLAMAACVRYREGKSKGYRAAGGWVAMAAAALWFLLVLLMELV